MLDEKRRDGDGRRKRPSEAQGVVLACNTLDQALTLPSTYGLDVADALREIDPRFGDLSEDDVERNIARARKGRWRTLRLVSELALACGAFDVVQRPGETKGAAIERAHEMLKKAVKRAEVKVRR